MAAVFKATLRGAEGFEKRLVVKQILPEFARDSELIQRFIAEAKLLVELNHANIVRIFELGVERGTYFIAMEYVDGQSLHELRRGPPFSLSEIVLVGASIAKALGYAHKRGIVHRDLTPRNVLIDREGHVFLIDFGLASRVASTDALDYGTEGYAAPEQMEDSGHVEPSADIYSLGKILERLAGRAEPHEGLAQLSVLTAHATKKNPQDRMDASSIEKSLRNLASEGGADERLAQRVDASAAEAGTASAENAFPAAPSLLEGPIPSHNSPSDADPKTASFANRVLELDQPGTRKLPSTTTQEDRAPQGAQKGEALSRSASTRSIFVTMGVFAVLLPLVPIAFVLSGATRSDAGVDPFVRTPGTIGNVASSPSTSLPTAPSQSTTGSQVALPELGLRDAQVAQPLAVLPPSAHRTSTRPDGGPSVSSVSSASAQTTNAFTDLFGEPGTRFRLDGVVLGNAPIRRHAISSGSHRVEATFDPTGESLSESITVHTGETLRIIAKFRSPVPTLTVERQ